MEVKELGHLVLYVRDVERSSRFYREVLGFRQIAPSVDDIVEAMSLPVAAYSSGRTHHELLLIEVGEDAPLPPPGRRAGLYHFGLKIGDSDDELRAALGELERAEVTVVGAADHTVTHSLYVLDPDGNEIELYVDVPGVDWHDPSALMSPVRPLAL